MFQGIFLIGNLYIIYIWWGKLGKQGKQWFPLDFLSNQSSEVGK